MVLEVECFWTPDGVGGGVFCVCARGSVGGKTLRVQTLSVC